jgi:hypothetical protein
MQIQNRSIGVAVGLLALYVGGSAVGSCSRDVAVLRTFDGNGIDAYSVVWAIADPPHLWIRAHRSDRNWLAHLIRYPKVELERNGTSAPYRATVYDRPDATVYVNERFRAEYGLADRWRELRDGDHPIPIRLDRS